jgi:hypothetical protein
MRWRLILEKYGPKLIYLPGDKNIVADALSWSSFNSTLTIDQHSQYDECFGATKDDLPIDIYPLKHSTLQCSQQQDKHLHRLMQTSNIIISKPFVGEK